MSSFINKDKGFVGLRAKAPSMHMNGHESRVANAIREVFANKRQRPPELGPDTVLDTSLGLESIDFAKLAVRLESEFGKDPFVDWRCPSDSQDRRLSRAVRRVTVAVDMVEIRGTDRVTSVTF